MRLLALLGALVLVALSSGTAWAGSAPVCLLNSTHSRAFFAAQGGDKDRLLAPWRALLQRLGYPACELLPEELNGAARPRVLVMASAVALSSSDRAAIDRFTSQGGSLLATWASGARDASGQWLGYQWLREQFGVEISGEIAAASEERFLLPFGDGPLSIGLGAGRRLFLTRAVEPLLRARLRESDSPVQATPAGLPPLASAAARYGVWHRHAPDGVAGHGAMTYLDHGGSRRLWLGVPETAWAAAQADIEGLIGNALLWALRTPRLGLAAWPAPYRAAFLVEMDTEDQFQHATVFAAALDRHQLPATFYCLTSEAAKFPDLVRRLGQRHEIAYHAEVHQGFKDQPPAEQEQRIANAIRQLAPMAPANRRPSGFRAPLESYDRHTEIAMRRLGIRHHAADPSSSDEMLPFFSTAEADQPPSSALVVLPRTLLDDVNFVRMGIAGEGVRHELLLGLADIERFRGFGLLSVHTQTYAPGGELDRGMDALLGELASRRSRLWVASADAIEHWWRQRAHLRVRLLSHSATHLEFEVSQTLGAGPIEGAQLIVMPGSATQVPVLTDGGPHSPRRAELVTALRLDADRWSVRLPPVAGTPKIYTLRLQPRH